jgi:hypothetical protein
MLSPTPHYYEIMGRAAEIIVAAANAPIEPHEDAVLLPEGQQLDGPLSLAIIDALPEGTTFGFNGRDGRTWIHVFGPGASLGPEVCREVLNTALASLGRPGVGR